MKNIFYFIFTALIISCNNDKNINITNDSNKLLDSTENTTDSVELPPTPLSTDNNTNNKPITKSINKPKEDLKNEVVVTAINEQNDTVNFYTFQDFLDNLSNNNTYYINVPKFNLSTL